METWTAEEQREIVTGLQVEAAEQPTVGAFRDEFRRSMEPLLAHNIVDESIYQQQMEIVSDAVEGNEDLQLATTEAHVLGYNTIGAGRGGVHLSRDMAANLGTQEDVFMMQHAAAHELAHGKEVLLFGELIVNGEAVDDQLLYEGLAEVEANREMGVSITQHRDGQPPEVYGEGQEIIVGLLQDVERSKLEKVLTETGNLDSLTVMLNGEKQQEEAAAEIQWTITI